MMEITFLQFGDCPHALPALEKLRALLKRESVLAEVEVIDIQDERQAHSTGFLGSPSIQINGYDIEPERRGDTPCIGCRIYDTPDGPGGVPEESLIMDAIQRASLPRRKLLFLCTGNSCRSQMAEGWARRLWGDLFAVWSAGIEPHGVDPRAVTVMAEAGVDISARTSDNVGDLLAIPFDYVITVCSNAYENCPIFPGTATVLHVGFDDPPKLAASASSEEEALDRYRSVRDEIRAFVATLPEFLDEQDRTR
jgi:arsenate reductase (thioredoxin)